MISAPVNDHNLKDRLVTEDGKIELGIYPVIYGFRVRAGYSNSGACIIDWCCGDNAMLLIVLYYRLKWHIEDNPRAPFKGLPASSKKKPITEDPEFFKEIRALLPRWDMRRYKEDIILKHHTNN